MSLVIGTRAKNPNQRLSGDQNGNDASSVPGRIRGFRWAIDRTHSEKPFEVYATNATIYTHVVDASHRNAVEALEERLFGELDCFGLKSATTADQSQPASAEVD